MFPYYLPKISQQCLCCMEAQPLFQAPPPCVLLVGGRAFILFPILFFYTPLYHFFVVLLSGHLTYSSLCLRCYRLVRVSILVPFSSPTRSASHRPFNFHLMESTVCPYTIPYHTHCTILDSLPVLIEMTQIHVLACFFGLFLMVDRSFQVEPFL